MIVPPFAGVRLVEYRDRIALTPLYWCREFVGIGRFKASEVGPQARTSKGSGLAGQGDECVEPALAGEKRCQEDAATV
jgi:hypothetical protein